MRKKGKPAKPPRFARKPVERRIPIKKRTMELLMERDQEFQVAQAHVEFARKGFQDTARSILSEHGLEGAIVKQVTQKPPYELIVEVPPKK